MSTIAERAIERALAGETVVIDHYGHDVKSGYIVEGPLHFRVEWITPDAEGVAVVAELLGNLASPGHVLVVDVIGRGTVAVEQCQRVSTEREAHQISRIRKASQFYDAKRGETKDAHTSAWIVRTPATALARELLGWSRWTYLASPVGSPRPGETLQAGTAHAYHSRESAERAIKNAQRRGREHAEHAEAVEVRL